LCRYNLGGLFRDDVEDVLMNQTVGTRTYCPSRATRAVASRRAARDARI
jgi:hypothetical protein